MNFGTGWVLGAIAMCLVSIFIVHKYPTKQQVGYTRQQLKEMKSECELLLPRSTECSIVVYYLPQAELEKTEW